MDKPSQSSRIVSIANIPILCLSGPEAFIQTVFEDPRVRSCLPGLDLAAPGTDGSTLYQVRFLPGDQRQMSWEGGRKTLTIEGDLESLGSRDIRFMTVYLTKSASFEKGFMIVHTAGLLSPGGETVLLYGSGNSGKSTISMLLTKSGYKILSTDLAILDANLQILRGTKHINLFPTYIHSHFRELIGFLPEADQRDTGYSKKIAIPQAALSTLDVFANGSPPAGIKSVFKVSLHREEDHPYCSVMDDHEKLMLSMVLHEDLATRIGWCPSWRLLFPTIRDPDMEIYQKQMALKLAELPHYIVAGDLDYCAGEVQKTCR